MHGGRIVVGVSALLAMVLVSIALAWLFQRRLIYLPSPGRVPPAATILHAGEDVAFDTADGLRLRAWFVPAATGHSRVAVLVLAGNAGNRAARCGPGPAGVLRRVAGGRGGGPACGPAATHGAGAALAVHLAGRHRAGPLPVPAGWVAAQGPLRLNRAGRRVALPGAGPGWGGGRYRPLGAEQAAGRGEPRAEAVRAHPER